MSKEELKQVDQEGMLALYDISQIINSIQEPEELFDRVMDLVISTTNAERGLLMLKEPTAGELSVKVARNFQRKPIENPDEISQTILNQVLENGEAVLTSDAKTDPRFSGSESVMLYNILSIICVPLKKQETVIGLIYVDSRTTKNVFTERDKVFLAAFANMAAISIENARLQARLRQENLILKEEISRQYRFENIVGQSPKFLTALGIVERVLDSSVPVLIQGESGTGKELVAKAIHYNGPRKENKFVAQYCGALPETLLESELFGYKKGAFTGASANKMGLFEVADGGTFFLDEIGDISPSIQAKLLRVLQDGEMRRVGDTQSMKVDVRVISATNRDLWQEVKAGRFREDLFYRLNVVTINLPSLRERQSDIPLLCRHFLLTSQAAQAKNIDQIETKAMELLMEYGWPGNIRELENAVSYAVVMAKSQTVRVSDLPEQIRNYKASAQPMVPGQSMRDMEKNFILATLKSFQGNRRKTAEQLGISLRTLQYKLKEFKHDEGELEA
jgi:Nif-specific regulatory protein